MVPPHSRSGFPPHPPPVLPPRYCIRGLAFLSFPTAPSAPFRLQSRSPAAACSAILRPHTRRFGRLPRHYPLTCPRPPSPPLRPPRPFCCPHLTALALRTCLFSPAAVEISSTSSFARPCSLGSSSHSPHRRCRVARSPSAMGCFRFPPLLPSAIPRPRALTLSPALSEPHLLHRRASPASLLSWSFTPSPSHPHVSVIRSVAMHLTHATSRPCSPLEPGFLTPAQLASVGLLAHAPLSPNSLAYGSYLLYFGFHTLLPARLRHALDECRSEPLDPRPASFFAAFSR